MSTWRQKAITCLPEQKKDFEDPQTSIYDVFRELLPAAIEFHKKNDIGRLRLIYDFAEWCFRQKNKGLWNAASVSFYEHLGDHKETSQEIRKWVKPDIYTEIRELLNWRLGEEGL